MMRFRDSSDDAVLLREISYLFETKDKVIRKDLIDNEELFICVESTYITAFKIYVETHITTAFEDNIYSLIIQYTTEEMSEDDFDEIENIDFCNELLRLPCKTIDRLNIKHIVEVIYELL